MKRRDTMMKFFFMFSNQSMKNRQRLWDDNNTVTFIELRIRKHRNLNDEIKLLNRQKT